MKKIYFITLFVVIMFATSISAFSQAEISPKNVEYRTRSVVSEQMLRSNSSFEANPIVLLTVKKDRSLAAGTSRIILKADNVWGDGSGYMILLDDTHTQFGQAIPELGNLTSSCNVPPDLQGKFTHFVPETAVISCTPGEGNFVVTGEAAADIPSGLYDFCIGNPEPDALIWISGGEHSRVDDFEFITGHTYTFEMQKVAPPEEGDQSKFTDDPPFKYTITTSVNGENGSISPTYVVTSGEDYIVQILPSDNFDLESLMDNGEEKISEINNFEYKLLNITQDHEIVAKFKDAELISERYTLKAVAEANGEIIPTSAMSVSGGEKTFIIKPSEEFEVKTLMDNGIDKYSDIVENKYTLSNIAENHDIKVDFKVKQFNLTATVDGANGTITPGEAIIDYNSSQVFEITIEEGYKVASLLDNDEEKKDDIVDNKYTLSNVKINHNIVIKFIEITYNPVSSLESSVLGLDVTLRWMGPVNRSEVVILEEGFENGAEGWTFIDADGDGYNWEITESIPKAKSHSGSYYVLSRSYLTETDPPLTPSNYMISPELSFAGEATLSYWVASQDPVFLDEYEVLFSTAGNTVADFSNPPLLSEVAKGAWAERTVILPIGTRYVAFRHFSPDKFFVKIDDIKITAEQQEYTYSVYRGEDKIKEGLMPSKFVDSNVPIGEYTYCVEVNYPSGINSIKTCKENIEVVEPTYAPITNLDATISWLDVSLSWTAPETAIAHTYTLYADDVKIAENLTKNNYILESVTIGTHKYCVEVNYPYGKNSEITCKNVVVDEPIYLPVTDMETKITYLNVKLSWTAPAAPVEFTYTIYGDDVKIVDNLTTSNYTVLNATVGSHNYCVEVNYPNNKKSEKVCKNADVLQPIYSPITDLKVTLSNLDVILTWTKPVLATTRKTIINENFESGVPEGWTFIDADGDGNNWQIWEIFPAPNLPKIGTCMTSASFAGLALTPDNYMITPELSLSIGGTLNYEVSTQDVAYPTEHYAIYASTTGKLKTDFITPLFEETLTADGPIRNGVNRGISASGSWLKRTVELPEGTKYVAFRHFNSTDNFRINIDNVVITDDAPDFTYSVYRDDANIATGINETTYKDLNVAVGKHKYCVEVNYDGGNNSKKVCEDVTTNIEDVLDYKILINGGNACINFDLETATEVRIYDAIGRLMSKEVKEGYSSDAYTPGLYLVHYTIGNVKDVVKVVVR